MEFLIFVKQIPSVNEKRKTEIWNVVSRRSGARLGVIKWFGRWRQYAFFPEPNTIWNPDCLDTVGSHIHELMEQRSRNRHGH